MPRTVPRLEKLFVLNTNKPYLPVRVNATGPYWFILDTGSITNVIDSEVAAALGLERGDSFEAIGAGEGSLKGATGRGVALDIGGLTLPAGPVDILPINKAIAFSEGRKVEGLLGYDFFAGFVVVLDYARLSLTVHEPDSYRHDPPDAGAVLPLELVRGNPFISAAITTADGERLAGWFLIDTAWRSALSLNAPFVAKHGLLNTTATIGAATGVGVGGPSIEAVGRVSTLHLGPLAVQNPVANFSRARAGILSQSDMTGIIGGDVLRRFTVTLDYPHKQLILEPNARFADPYEFDMSGLMATTHTDDLKTLGIYHVVENSPAHEAGLKPGDIITSIDGLPAGELSLDQVRNLFRKTPGKQHEIAILRNEAKHTCTITLRRLV